MRRIIGIGLALAALGAAASSALVSSAAASGPAAPGKQLHELTCEGFGTITVSVPRAEMNNGVGQIVGQRGHGIPVSFGFSLTDLTTNSVIFSETMVNGHGHAHPNQTTTTCTETFFEGSASEFFGSELPPEVGESDQLLGVFTIQVIAKL